MELLVADWVVWLWGLFFYSNKLQGYLKLASQFLSLRGDVVAVAISVTSCLQPVVDIECNEMPRSVSIWGEIYYFIGTHYPLSVHYLFNLQANF